MLTKNDTPSDVVEYRGIRSTDEFMAALRSRQSQPYEEFLQSSYWKDVRTLVLQRDGCCGICRSTLRLEVHHKTYENRGDELRHLGDLMTLCNECHVALHQRGGGLL